MEQRSFCYPIFLKPNVALTIEEMKTENMWGFIAFLFLKAILPFQIVILPDLLFKKPINKTNPKRLSVSHDSRSWGFEKMANYLVICNKIMIFSNTSKILSILAYEY